jgi:hypothetical protein
MRKTVGQLYQIVLVRGAPVREFHLTFPRLMGIFTNFRNDDIELVIAGLPQL